MKLSPVLLLPVYLLYMREHGFSRRDLILVLSLGLLGLAGYLSWIARFGPTYLTTYSPVTQPLPVIPGPYVISGSIFWLVLFYCFIGLFARKSDAVLGMAISTFLVYFAVSNPYPQYLIWVMPLLALDIALVKRRRLVLLAVWSALAFLQWFLVSSTFLTPSGFSLLLMQLTPHALPGYSTANLVSTNSLVGRLWLPLVSSAFYAVNLVYLADVTWSWFRITVEKIRRSTNVAAA